MNEAKLDSSPTKITHRARLLAAYDDYIAQKPGSLDDLFEAVLRFAYARLSSLQTSFREEGDGDHSAGLDDWAQMAAYNAWESFGSWRGSSFGEFFGWLRTICDHVGVDVYRKRKRARDRMVPLWVPADPDEQDGLDEKENPAIYEVSGYTGPASVSKWFRLADSEDTEILDLLLAPVEEEDGISRVRTWTEIAAALGKPVSAVQKRFSRLKQRVHDAQAIEKEQLRKGVQWRLQRRETALQHSLNRDRLRFRALSERNAIRELMASAPSKCEVAFKETLSEMQDLAASVAVSGLVKAQNFRWGGKAPSRFRPTLVDYAFDLDLAARRTLSKFEYQVFESVRAGNLETSQVNERIRHTLGAAFIHRGIYPVAKYMNWENVEVVFKDHMKAA